MRAVALRSLTEAIDTSSSGGRLIFHIFGALAEFEHSIIRERTTLGLISARTKGRIGGRPPSLIDEDLKVARAMLANPEITIKDVANQLNISLATLYRYIKGGRSQL